MRVEVRFRAFILAQLDYIYWLTCPNVVIHYNVLIGWYLGLFYFHTSVCLFQYFQRFEQIIDFKTDLLAYHMKVFQLLLPNVLCDGYIEYKFEDLRTYFIALQVYDVVLIGRYGLKIVRVYQVEFLVRIHKDLSVVSLRVRNDRKCYVNLCWFFNCLHWYCKFRYLV